jgi:ABC transporter substrate binding protein
MFQLGPFADTNGFMYRCKQTRGLDRRPKRPRKYAAELVALAPEVILAHSSAAVAPLLQATRTVPIVFTTVADPVGAGYIDSLARPGGNATGASTWWRSIFPTPK